MRSHIKPA